MRRCLTKVDKDSLKRFFLCQIKTVLFIFVEGYPVIISTKLFRILTKGFRREDYFFICFVVEISKALGATFLTDLISVSCFL